MNGAHPAGDINPMGMPLLSARSAHVDALDDAIHHLAQPLTALMFIIEMGRLQPTADLWKTSLDSAVEECRRAIAALDAVRGAAAELTSDRREDA